MEPPIRSSYKGIRFTVQQGDEPEVYQFQFQVGGIEIKGKTKTRLAGMAVRRARIDRKLGEARAAQ
jgi:hypothetical protein